MWPKMQLFLLNLQYWLHWTKQKKNCLYFIYLPVLTRLLSQLNYLISNIHMSKRLQNRSILPSKHLFYLFVWPLQTSWTPQFQNTYLTQLLSRSCASQRCTLFIKVNGLQFICLVFNHIVFVLFIFLWLSN